MQIHEITRRPIKEDVVSGLTNMLYKSAGVANPLDSLDQTRLGPKVDSNLRQGAAGEMNKTLLAPLAKEMQKRWAQVVQQLVSTSKSVADPKIPATGADQLDRSVLEKELYQFVNQLAGVDIGELKDDGSGQANLLKTEIKPQITAAIADTQKPNPGADVWLPLATSIQRAKSIKNFSQGADNTANNQVATVTFDPSNNPLYNGKPYNANDPSHRMALTLQQKLLKNPQP